MGDWVAKSVGKVGAQDNQQNAIQTSWLGYVITTLPWAGTWHPSLRVSCFQAFKLPESAVLLSDGTRRQQVIGGKYLPDPRIP